MWPDTCLIKYDDITQFTASFSMGSEFGEPSHRKVCRAVSEPEDPSFGVNNSINNINNINTTLPIDL